MRRPQLIGTRLWTKYEGRLLELFFAAIELLQNRDLKTVTDEDDISRTLSQCLETANLRLRQVGRGFDMIPVFNAPTQPRVSDPVRVSAVFKRPDFQHQLIDDVAQLSVYYNVECKRLGDSHFSNDYVDDGVKRFLDPSHSYGRDCCSGAMIGYLQNAEPERVLAQVNTRASSHKIPVIKLSMDGWCLNGVSRLDNIFERMFPVTRFHLRHLWIDLRHHY
ncbi:MAG: hypothetical protein ABFD54_15125 [Armatimonadota bacterium]|nr:hypothetical protein [bacterium]